MLSEASESYEYGFMYHLVAFAIGFGLIILFLCHQLQLSGIGLVRNVWVVQCVRKATV